MKKNRFSKILRPGREKAELEEQLEQERRTRDRQQAERLQHLEWELQQERKKRAEEEEARRFAAAQEASRRDYEKQETLRRERTFKIRERERMQQAKTKAKIVSSEKLRELRDLMRTRYELDVEIWTLRGVRGPDRPVVMEKMERADAVLTTIMETIESWEDTRDSWTADEWEKIGQVYDRLKAPGKRWWREEPPWPAAR
jgi:hypothetical protein